MRVVLASASARRRALLAHAGLDFVVEPADVDETLPRDAEPVSAARALAERKARAIAARHPEPVLVLGADTIVARDVGGAHVFYGKPGTPAEAAAMLGALAGSRHAVVTGICVVRTADQRAFVDSERTWVTMRALAPREIDAYVATGEWRDKAGGYAIQERAESFVTALEEGGFDNVVGLPVARTLALLRVAGARLAGDAAPR